MPVVFAWSMYSGGLRQLVQVRWPLHLVRGVMSVFMMVTFTFALKSLTLAKAYSIFFIAPLLIALLSIVMLGERVQRAQWGAIAVGFAGVLIVLKPETGGFGWWGTLAVLGTAVCYSLSSVHRENSRPHRQHAVDDVLDDRHAGLRGHAAGLAGMAIHCTGALSHPGGSRGHRRHRSVGHHGGVQARAGRERRAARIHRAGVGDA